MFHSVLCQINIGVYSELFNQVYITEYSAGISAKVIFDHCNKIWYQCHNSLKVPEKQPQNKLDTPLFKKRAAMFGSLHLN